MTPCFWHAFCPTKQDHFILLTVKEKQQEYYTIAQVAKTFQKSQRTIRRWIKEGKLRSIKLQNALGKGHHVIQKEELEKLIL